MNKTTFKVLFSMLLVIFANDVLGQSSNTVPMQFTPSGYVRCYTNENEAFLKSEHPRRRTIEEFESVLAPFIEKIKAEKTTSRNSNATPTTVYKIPVVIHIIHNGDAVGANENISDAQALSQITVLNQDFRRMLGTPGYNTNPVGADMEIEFVMAKRTPTGLTTNGIDRVNTGLAQYANRTAVENMKQATVWDTTKYMNMWTVNIGGGTPDWNGVLGYAQFPTNAGIIGLDNNYNPATTTEASTDGLVMRHNAFGSRALVPGGTFINTYDQGRTATHEIGHWAGLRHIWGDGDCTADDFCEDTPNAADSNGGCPTGIDSCPASPGVDMIENYMDYTNDACMNIFTQDQKNRVQAVFLFADRRNSLLYSDALVPVGLALDAGVSLESDGVDGCNLGINPKVRLKNYGSTTLTSAQITYSLDNVNIQTFNYTGSLATGQSTVITLSNTLIFSNSQQNLYINLNLINGATSDGFSDNDATGKKVNRPVAVTGNTVTFNLQLDYYGSETSWDLKDGAGMTIYSGSLYTDTPTTGPPPALITQTWNLSPNSCYTFTINDTFGDGLFGGYYEVISSGGQTVFNGGGYKYTFSNKFIINALGSDSFDVIEDLKVYPNPNKGSFTISFNSESDKTNITIHYIRGRQIFKNDYNDSGLFNQTIDLKNTESGIYLVTINNGTKKVTKKILVE